MHKYFSSVCHVANMQGAFCLIHDAQERPSGCVVWMCVCCDGPLTCPPVTAGTDSGTCDPNWASTENGWTVTFSSKFQTKGTTGNGDSPKVFLGVSGVVFHPAANTRVTVGVVWCAPTAVYADVGKGGSYKPPPAAYSKLAV